mmetsp:Transcript_14535/g.41412  ORF Transcript_14535/g.41412 Transcript_14535/m.41412 type:complete len:201 (+) Transcript_14535:1843-2445(+)
MQGPQERHVVRQSEQGESHLPPRLLLGEAQHLLRGQGDELRALHPESRVVGAAVLRDGVLLGPQGRHLVLPQEPLVQEPPHHVHLLRLLPLLQLLAYRAKDLGLGRHRAQVLVLPREEGGQLHPPPRAGPRVPERLELSRLRVRQAHEIALYLRASPLRRQLLHLPPDLSHRLPLRLQQEHKAILLELQEVEQVPNLRRA